MTHSPLLEQAKVYINEIKGKKLSIEERRDRAIKLAALMQHATQYSQTHAEKEQQEELARMMDDPEGKVFTMSLTDQCFRTENSWRIADQILFLMKRLGIPRYLSRFKRFQLSLFQLLGGFFAPFLSPLVKEMIHRQCSRFILPGEEKLLIKAIQQKEKVRVNLNHLGEAILGEEEAEQRINTYLHDLTRPEVEYVSVKVSTLCSQLNLIAWEETLAILEKRFKRILNVAHAHMYTRPDGSQIPKFVNLDMEEYRDLDLTVELFKKVLGDPAYYTHSAGIVLQSYLPDSYLVQQDLTVWAMQRRAKGGAPIKIRIVKGANLAMERVDASLHGWPQTPYLSKFEADSNFKRMMHYAFQKKHVDATNIGIGSHNLFDIAYALLLRAENEVEKEVTFEMLDGMANAQRRIVQALAGDLLLYCPAAEQKEFQNAVAYLIRRLDENTSPDNFLRHAFHLKVDSPAWKEQVELFSHACEASEKVSALPRRTQNRFSPEIEIVHSDFSNDEDTDWSLSQNRAWAKRILDKWSQMSQEKIPLVIGGEILKGIKEGVGMDPSNPQHTPYTYALAGSEEIEKALQGAVTAQEKWGQTSPEERSNLLTKVAQLLKQHREDLIGVMIADTGKVIAEGDVEVSEAIDFVEYYRRNILDISKFKDIRWHAKGPTLVAPPWNFPCSIPIGGIAAALAAGNSVIFKPAPESVWVGWILVQLFWEAGIDKDVLQFVNCEDEPYGSQLIQDPRLELVVLTGASATAKHFLKLRPDLQLLAETGGKNALIVSNLADRDQAVKDIVQSAFGHAGQKCSACSLVICLEEVYEDPQFRRQLRDAVASLKVGTPWQASSRLNPLIREPGEVLKRGLTRLEEGEEWLLQPQQDSENPCLWSPGIKWGVQPGSFTQQNELFGPVLGVMKAENLEQAIQLANQTPYGLTSGLHSLDVREQEYWADHIEAGNCYINRGITGAIVQRQPFGGWKESGFSPGAKAGGPNYLMQFMRPEQVQMVLERASIPSQVQPMIRLLSEYSLEKQELWKHSVENYAFYWNHYFSQKHDPSYVLGEDNFLRYISDQNLQLRISSQDDPIDILRAMAAARICGAKMTVSSPVRFSADIPGMIIESDEQFLKRVDKQKMRRVRFFTKPEAGLRTALAERGCCMIIAPVLTNGRVELLHYLKEQSLTISYHRYGNLGEREITEIS